MSRLADSVKRSPSIVAVVLALGVLDAPAVAAQCRTPALAGPGTLVGTISDLASNPIDSVDVFIVSKKRQTVTVDGKFRFDKLEPGQYNVSMRRIGYPALMRPVTVGDSGGAVGFCVAQLPRTLAPVITSAPRGGLTGVIADTAFGIVAGAEITVLGGGQHTESDSAGIFYVPLKPGRYMVRVQRPGFQSKMVSVAVPSDSGRKMLIWLAPSTRGAAAREAFNAQELALRLDTISPARAKIFTREDINKFGATELRQLAQAGAVSYVDDDCMAIVDGGPSAVPIWTLKAEDLEMVEVYTSKLPRNAPTSIANQRRVVAPRCPVRVFAWLRKP
jgi:carboxypeptidase family protein